MPIKENLTIEQLKNLPTSGKLTDEVLSKLEEGLKRDFTIEESSRYAGISPATYYNYCNLSEEFREKMERARDFLFISAKNVWVDHIVNKKDLTASIELLKRRRKKLYSERQELTGEDGEKLQDITVTYINDTRNDSTKENKSE